MSQKKERYYCEHREEYWELFMASQRVETKEEMKQINKKIRKLYGRDRAIPVEVRFPPDMGWMSWMTIGLGTASILISLVSMILPILFK